MIRVQGKLKLLAAATALLCVLCPAASAAVRYVNVNSATPLAPYTNWSAASRTIQAAVEASAHGDLILVTNGVYTTGGRTFKGANRVALTRAVTVQSVNGPAATMIVGQRAPGATNGIGAIRCAYLTNGAMLIGFTLTNGATRTDGDVFVEQSGGGVWCESIGAAVYNCTLTRNSANFYGAGAYSGTLSNCTVIGNWAGNYGGGAAVATMSECALSGNSAGGAGGTYGGSLSNCTLTANSAGGVGGGAAIATLNNCTLTGNSAVAGGGAFDCTLKNCVISGNSASDSGGGATSGTLYNCIVTGNSAPSGGGTSDWPGYDSPPIYNSIVYYNTAFRDPNYTGSIFNYSCTTPFPETGIGNFVIEPELASASHLSANSPCIGRGSSSFASGVDIDGQAWANPPSMGCDEFYSGSATGAVTVGVSASFTNVAPGFSVDFLGFISGRASASRWEFGDGTVVSNRPYASYAWSAVGDYTVVLRVYNDSFPAGVTATNIIHVVKGEYYVAPGNATPAFPYTSWATAAANIQDAVDAASVPGATVLVTNGVYQTGGRAVTGAMTNRVAVDKPLTVRSINGPQFTIIRGYQEPGSPYGDSSIRCAYLAGGAMLAGFTLTNGATRSGGSDYEASRVRSGGGVNCESTNAILTNCVLAGNLAHTWGGGTYSGTLKNCTLTGNHAYNGGGANGSILNNCTLIDNSANDTGGGAVGGTLNDCILSGNSANLFGGGAVGSTLNHCTLNANSAYEGGGSFRGTLTRCALTGNSATDAGGGVYDGDLRTCELIGNSAREGGGAYLGTLNNCTLIGNIASWSGGGVANNMLTNCIVYYNSAQNNPNYVQSSLYYSCTTPLPDGGVGNLDAEPELASPSHLSANSPCIGHGAYVSVNGVDIDGEPWSDPPSIGCDEFYTGSTIGAITVSVAASYTNVAAGFSVTFQGFIAGQVSASRWEFGDGTVVSNRPYASHAWTVDGDYPVILRAYNDSFPAGITATIMIHVVSAVHYVALDSAAPTPPYVSWETAATNIQDAVDVAATVGALVLVTNGVYQTGGRAVFGAATNRVAVDKLVRLRSVNGPQFTIIKGFQVTPEEGGPNADGAIRCVYLTNGATLSGFTITNGATQAYGDYERETLGGGLWCESTAAIVSNCVISGNSAHGGGGGAYFGTLKNCLLTGNSGGSGGGASSSTLTNCTLSGNFAENGGGTAYGELTSCTVTGNWATERGGGTYGGVLNNCTLTGNWATNAAGGALDGILHNCTLTGNWALLGGGSSGGELYNCILSGNRAYKSGGGSIGGDLHNCALSANSADYSGGGVYSCNLSNCTLAGNSAEFGGGAFISYSSITLINCTLNANWAYWAGGVYGGELNNCTLTGNSAFWAGGAYYSTMANCTLVGNSADFAGGSYYGTLNNCIVISNTAVLGENYLYSTLNNSCTAPLPTNGVGNISTDPLFTDYAGGNLRLQPNSPCINSGLNLYAAAGPDLAGNPRVAGGTVDIGAYEFQSPASLISYAWLRQYGLVPSASVDSSDSDGDGASNWQEWIAGTDPTSDVSVLRIVGTFTNTAGINVVWQSVTNRTYFIERGTNLAAASSFLLLQESIVGQTGATTYTDSNAIGSGPFFYRVGIQDSASK